LERAILPSAATRRVCEALSGVDLCLTICVQHESRTQRGKIDKIAVQDILHSLKSPRNRSVDLHHATNLPRPTDLPGPDRSLSFWSSGGS